MNGDDLPVDFTERTLFIRLKRLDRARVYFGDIARSVNSAVERDHGTQTASLRRSRHPHRAQKIRRTIGMRIVRSPLCTGEYGRLVGLQQQIGEVARLLHRVGAM